MSRRAIEELLGKLKALDDQVAELVRPLSPAQFRTLTGVLDLIRRQQAAAVGIGPGRDYPQWYAELAAALEAGTAGFDQWAPAARLGSILFIADRITGLRQVAPRPPAPPAATGPGEGRDPVIVAATEPLFQRFRAVIGRVAPGKADPRVDAELEALLADERVLARRTSPGTLDRADSDFRIASVLNQLGRSAAFQGSTTAPGWFAQAAAVWRSLGDEDQVADCLQRSALAVLASDGDVDRALELMLAELDRQPGEPAVFKARLLAQVASILANAGDPFDAASRIGEAVGVLAALGFADPTSVGAERAFAAWMADGRLGDRTQATLSAVTSLWASITGTRTQLPLADRHRSGTSASDALLATTLSDLSALARRLGIEASTAVARIDADVAALTQPAARDAAPPADSPLAEELIAAALAGLRDRYDVTQDTPGLSAIVAEAATLEQEATAARLPALAVAAALLRGDTLSWLNRNEECARVLATACENLEKATGIADSERRALLVQLFMRTTMAHAMHGDFTASSAAAEKGIVIAELDRGKASSPYLQDSYLRERRRLYDAGVFAAVKLGDFDLLLRRAELAKARGSLGWLASQAGGAAASATDPDPLGPDPLGPDPESPDLEAEFRALSARPGQGDPAVATRRRILWTRLMAQRARRHGVAALEPFSLSAVQARLDPRDVIVYHYWLSQTVLLIVTIDHLSCAVERVDLEGSRDELAEIAAALASLDGQVEWLDEEIPPLGRLLLPREGAPLLAGKRRLLISPQGFLHQLPFHAFDWEGEPLISRLAVCYIPNLTTLLAARAAAGSGPRVFGLGISRFPAARPLINAPAELAGVTAAYQGTGTQVTTLAEEAATRERVGGLGASGQLRDFSVLHFATHGQSGSSDDPYSASLLLADGQVDGLDISQWDLGAELVVLSACRVGQRAISGRGQVGEALFGDEMFGLPAAFLSAGAREVLGGLWPVNDRAAVEIMPALHQHLAEGRPSDEALALAINAYRAQSPGMYKWAPLKLVSIARPTPTTRP
ncbi:MAG TPA: CHAT domain-containing protein [Trebonia sp.]|nr:CHAT domain-containing protein [Trebonia sp.]